MKTLMLLRHAKAAAQPKDDDFARALTDRGIEEAECLGRHLAALGLLPELALVSAAARTRQTFELLGVVARRQIAARFEESLYNASENQIRDVLRFIAADIGNLMVVGHNPGIMDAAVLLSRDGDVEELARLRGRFPPCALAVISFAADDWRDARVQGGRLDLFLLPEDIGPAA